MKALNIEVAYANSKTSVCLGIQVPIGCTIEQAIAQSGICQLYPEIDLNNINKVGIFGKLKSLEDEVNEGDRVEIYRPLTRDAMAARVERLKKQKVKRQLQVKDRE